MSARRAIIRADLDVYGRRWFWLFVYPNPDDLRRAAVRHTKEPAARWATAGGCVHPVINDAIGNGYAGVIRLSAEYCTAEVITHEAVHAALAVWRGNVHRDVRLLRECGPREEAFAYLVGELAAALTDRLYDMGVWTRAVAS